VNVALPLVYATAWAAATRRNVHVVRTRFCWPQPSSLARGEREVRCECGGRATDLHGGARALQRRTGCLAIAGALPCGCRVVAVKATILVPMHVLCEVACVRHGSALFTRVAQARSVGRLSAKKSQLMSGRRAVDTMHEESQSAYGAGYVLVCSLAATVSWAIVTFAAAGPCT
jgi:hypothetical protein